MKRIILLIVSMFGLHASGQISMSIPDTVSPDQHILFSRPNPPSSEDSLISESAILDLGSDGCYLIELGVSVFEKTDRPFIEIFDSTSMSWEVVVLGPWLSSAGVCQVHDSITGIPNGTDHSRPVQGYLVGESIYLVGTSLSVGPCAPLPNDPLLIPLGGTQEGKALLRYIYSGSRYGLRVGVTSGPTQTDWEFKTRVTKLNPEVSIEPDSSLVCLGGSQVLTAHGADTYEWLTQDGLMSSADSLAIVAPTTSTAYSVIGTDSLGCRDTAWATVTPVHLDFDLDIIHPTCIKVSDGTITIEMLEGTPPYSYFLDGQPIPSPEIQNLGPGSHQIEVVDSVGCRGMATETLIAPLGVDAHVEKTDISCANVCDGQIIVRPFRGVPPYIVLVDGDALDDSVATGLCLGLRIVEIVDSRGCEWRRGVIIQRPEPFVLDPVDPIETSGGPVTIILSGNYSIIDSVDWGLGIGILSGSSATFVPDSSVLLEVRAWSDQGCTATTTLEIVVVQKAQCGDGIFIPTAFTPNGDGYNDYFFVDGENFTIEKFEVYNRWGRKAPRTPQLGHFL